MQFHYPSLAKDANLRVMDTWRKHMIEIVGYSDHTMGINVALASVAMRKNTWKTLYFRNKFIYEIMKLLYLKRAKSEEGVREGTFFCSLKSLANMR